MGWNLREYAGQVGLDCGKCPGALGCKPEEGCYWLRYYEANLEAYRKMTVDILMMIKPRGPE